MRPRAKPTQRAQTRPCPPAPTPRRSWTRCRPGIPRWRANPGPRTHPETEASRRSLWSRAARSVRRRTLARAAEKAVCPRPFRPCSRCRRSADHPGPPAWSGPAAAHPVRYPCPCPRLPPRFRCRYPCKRVKRTTSSYVMRQPRPTLAPRKSLPLSSLRTVWSLHLSNLATSCTV